MKINKLALYSLAIDGELSLAFLFINNYPFIPPIRIIGKITIWLICNIGLIFIQNQVTE